MPPTNVAVRATGDLEFTISWFHPVEGPPSGGWGPLQGANRLRAGGPGTPDNLPHEHPSHALEHQAQKRIVSLPRRYWLIAQGESTQQFSKVLTIRCQSP